MISVPEARLLLKSHYPAIQTERILLSQAAGRILATDVLSPVSVPGFDNSAMDGYAFYFDGWNGGDMEIVGESAAGKPFAGMVSSGEAVRIFTGASIPRGADTVVMQEKCELANSRLQVLDSGIFKGANVRLAGSQNKAGDTLCEKHTYLSAGVMGMLAGCGIAEVEVFKLPVLEILVTGDEIIPPGMELKAGQLHESNSYSLIGALHPFAIVPRVSLVKDSKQAISDAVKIALERCDILLVTGGVSVGDYDYVVPVLEEHGVKRLFHRVKQKPAKPLYAGIRNHQMVYGLPGNPASVLTSFYVYVQPLLNYLLGKADVKAEGELFADFKRKPGLTQFLKGYIENGIVKLTDGQESYRMDGFAKANCLIEISEETEVLSAGDTVPVLIFPL